MKLPHFRLLSICFTNSLLCNFVAIYSYTVLNVPQSILRLFVYNSFYDHFGYHLSDQAEATLWGFLVCSWDIGGTVGALATAWLDERFGRKDSLFILNNLINLSSCTFILFAKGFNSFELLIIGRFVSGIASGVAATSVGVFATECAPTKLRGFVGSFSFCLQPLICILAMLLGLPNVLGDDFGWCYLLSLSGLVSILLLFLSSVFPESPKYLYIERQQYEKAAESVKFYYGNDASVEEAFEEFEKESILTRTSQVSWKEIVTLKHLRMPLILSCVANFSQDAVGSDVLSNYSTEIVQQLSGMSSYNSMITSVVSLVPGIVAAVMSTMLMESAGRKSLLISGILISTVGNCVLMASSFLQQPNQLWVFVIVGTVGVQSFAGYLGPASIPQFIFGEITPTSSRAFTAAVSMGVNYAASILYSFIYPPLSGLIHGYAFLIMIIPSILCALYLFVYLPEPKGKTVDEIVSIWMNSSNNVKREEVAHNDERSPLLQQHTDSDLLT